MFMNRMLLGVCGQEESRGALNFGMDQAGSGVCGSSDDLDAGDPSRKKKRHHRHTAHQIQELEALFRESPHPDEKQRLQLSKELGLSPRQIKFWFQNRRTQMKAQHDRADNCALRSENDKIRCENIAMREALKNVICPACGGPPVNEDTYFEEQKLRMENIRLKAELERISNFAAKYIGRPISQLPPIQPISVSSLDLSVGSFGSHRMGHPSLDLDPSAAHMPQLPMQTVTISDAEKSLMAEVAANAVQEVIRLLQSSEPLWMKSAVGGKDVLNLEVYERIFSKPADFKYPKVRIEASRDSALVIMNGLALVDMFMNAVKWTELFPTIISKARTIEVLASGVGGSKVGALHLMYEELQMLSPLVSTREFYFLRSCQQIEQGTWVIADISFDFSGLSQIAAPSQSCRLPSGCLIQDMPNGYAKISWVEHAEMEEGTGTHRIFRDLINSGLAFGAERWLTTLQRMCERYACLMVTGNSSSDVGGVIPSSEGRKSLMKLSQRMITNFCANLTSSNVQRWTTLSGLNDSGVRVSVHKSSEPGQPNGVVLSAATSLWLPVSPLSVFNFFRDECTRTQWDVLSNGNSFQEVAHIANGSNPGNCISILRAFNANQNNMLILQESCTDAFCSLVVYAPVDLPAMNVAMGGEDTSYIPLLPSGFIILPDGRDNPAGGGASTSNSGPSSTSGSIITVAFQILVSSLPSARLNLESVSTVNNLISTTVQQIKAALNCDSAQIE